MSATLSERRIATIRASAPSEAAIARSFSEGARTRAEAIERAYQRRIETAERHDRGEHYGAANYSSRILRETPGATAHERQVRRRIDQNNEALRMAALDRAVEKQPHVFTSGASPSVGEAPASPLVGASTHSMPGMDRLLSNVIQHGKAA